MYIEENPEAPPSATEPQSAVGASTSTDTRVHFWEQRHSIQGWEHLKPSPAGAKLRLRGQALVGHGLAPVLELRATREVLGRSAGQAGQALLGGSFDKAETLPFRLAEAVECPPGSCSSSELSLLGVSEDPGQNFGVGFISFLFFFFGKF